MLGESLYQLLRTGIFPRVLDAHDVHPDAHTCLFRKSHGSDSDQIGIMRDVKVAPRVRAFRTDLHGELIQSGRAVQRLMDVVE